jgi:signal peptidase I
VEKVKGRKFLILPAVRARYTFYIDETPHTLTVPAEFDMGSALDRAFDLGSGSLRRIAGEDNLRLLELDEQFKAGDDILRFDITLGDALFVDRFSYHFRKPQVGDPFVFRTNNIPEALAGDVEKYYIKRLAGTEAETLEIRDGQLLSDGKPRDEVAAFERNAAREGEYDGYVNIGKLAEGEQMTVPENFFVALGDNSGNSKDSRYWGFVPEKSVIGKAFFIYYPFTRRWGLSE